MGNRQLYIVAVTLHFYKYVKKGKR